MRRGTLDFSETLHAEEVSAFIYVVLRHEAAVATLGRASNVRYRTDKRLRKGDTDR
jgi:hypothetical protein